MNDDGVRRVDIVEARLAHQTRLSVHFRAARAALGRFAVPAHGEVGRLFRLDVQDRVEYHPAGFRLDMIVDFLERIAFAPQNAEGDLLSRLHAAHTRMILSVQFRANVMRWRPRWP
jgi:hypothetical protein